MLEPWVARSASLPTDPLGSSVRECGAAGSVSGQTAFPLRPILRQSRSRHGHSSPLRPGARLRHSYPSGCMFLFYLLGVRLPCRWIFCQFWLWEEVQCVYLCRNLGSQSGSFLITVSISSGVIGLFRLSASSVSFGGLYFSRNLSISSRFSNFLAYSLHSNFLQCFVFLCYQL